MSNTIKIKKIDPCAQIPAKAHPGDIGFDVCAVRIEWDRQAEVFIYHSGIAAETDYGMGILAMARSNIAKYSLVMPNGVGLIDSFLYRGEICWKFAPVKSISARALSSALKTYLSLPFYKRIFNSKKKFDKILESTTEYIHRNMLHEAPYCIGERFGQLVFFNHPDIELVEVDELSTTERGAGGWGSTGL